MQTFHGTQGQHRQELEVVSLAYELEMGTTTLSWPGNRPNMEQCSEEEGKVHGISGLLLQSPGFDSIPSTYVVTRSCL